LEKGKVTHKGGAMKPQGWLRQHLGAICFLTLFAVAIAATHYVASLIPERQLTITIKTGPTSQVRENVIPILTNVRKNFGLTIALLLLPIGMFVAVLERRIPLMSHTKALYYMSVTAILLIIEVGILCDLIFYLFAINKLST
jgi:hypothetical protein